MIDDKTYAELREIAARYPQARSGCCRCCISCSRRGSVTPAGIDACAEVLGLTPAEVSAVATFYTMYKRHRVGDFHVGVCTNTLCAVMGGDAIHQRLTEHLGVARTRWRRSGRATSTPSASSGSSATRPVTTRRW